MYAEDANCGYSRSVTERVRAFDIRLKEKNGKLGVFHSHAFQDIYWEEDVLLAFISFLQAHPSETLIVSLKKEGGEIKDYASLLSASLNTPAYQRHFIADFHPELTLKSCRGKILFLHRDLRWIITREPPASVGMIILLAC